MALSRRQQREKAEALKASMIASGGWALGKDRSLRVIGVAEEKASNPGASVQEAQRAPRREYGFWEVYGAASKYCLQKRGAKYCPCPLEGRLCISLFAPDSKTWGFSKKPEVISALEEAGYLR